tara:strand:+ start:197 stop:355 length:159 start_codon:yes stop_codon:yes gene_type:complete
MMMKMIGGLGLGFRVVGLEFRVALPQKLFLEVFEYKPNGLENVLHEVRIALV